jgi:hypothetical protein
MFTPFEELEYLADYLPEEGEAVLISRRDGELVCEPFSDDDDLRGGVANADLYGKLVVANERLNDQGSLPLWTCALGLFWLSVVLHNWLQLGWQFWFLVPGLGLLSLMGCVHWIRQRQRQYFVKHIWPELKATLQRDRIPFHALVGGVKQHRELRTLLDELSRLTT